ncbi:helix-turn-helix transcriptional regulator [Siminovitchia fordii]|uniref:SPBc2 prophage-derived uncharacterized HTH-type transcriptional regulator YopS n=1 Tax=Siminovitchia fordii TaxID=254759 RepID=A0ABQ4KA31_9BACI|nr:helix-turn-helix transcriptional regulator [Siminovitchia fordii]GIN22576.1 SPBc2 prophage-derived uncharacterized HTH-type transcriptional regulator YopS [Siminovitchia fordii]
MKKIEIGKCLLPELLYKRKMTQVQLEARTGIDRRQINAYIKGNRKMSLVNAKVIAEALGCAIDDLYEWKR